MLSFYGSIKRKAKNVVLSGKLRFLQISSNCQLSCLQKCVKSVQAVSLKSQKLERKFHMVYSAWVQDFTGVYNALLLSSKTTSNYAKWGQLCNCAVWMLYHKIQFYCCRILGCSFFTPTQASASSLFHYCVTDTGTVLRGLFPDYRELKSKVVTL